MAERAEDPPDPFVDPKTGRLTYTAVRWLQNQLTGASGTQIGSILSGQNTLQETIEDVQTTATQQVAAANQAATAAIVAGGSTVTDYDSATDQSVTSGTYATFLTCNITTTGAGNHTLTATLTPTVVSATALINSGSTFAGDWRIIENAGTNVLVSGTFTITQTLNGGEGGDPFYTYSIAFGTALPSEDAFASVGVGAVTVELQLRRASGSNQIAGLAMTLLTEWA